MSRGRRSSIPCSIAIALLVLPGGPTAGAADPQKPAPDARPAIVERTGAELVLIEAYVTDDRGLPIPGLTEDNFVLSVDGRVRPLASLEYVAVQSRPPARTEPGAVPAHEPPPRRIILFFEDGTSAPSGLNLARRASETFLSTGLLPRDEVAVASFDHGLRLLCGFTTDRDALAAAVHESLEGGARLMNDAAEMSARREEVKRLGAQSRQTVVNQGSALTGKQHQAAGGPAAGHAVDLHAYNVARMYAGDEWARLRAVVRATRSLVESLRAYQGYKAIVFMGDGIPENAFQPYLDILMRGEPSQDTRLDMNQFDLTPEIKSLAYSASSSGVTLHTLQTTGVAAGSAAELRAASTRTNALKTLALATGGTFAATNEPLKALLDVDAAGRAYYLLGYAPEGPPDGAYHSVQVRVKGRSAQVRWRRGFVRYPPAEARERLVEAAHMVPEMNNPMGIELAAIPGPVEGARRVVDLVVHVPPGQAFLPSGGGLGAALNVGVVGLDAARTEVFRLATRVAVDLHEEPGARRGDLGIDFYRRVLLPLAAQTITVVVDDPKSLALGAAHAGLPLERGGGPSALGLSLYSLDEVDLWIELPETAGDPGEDEPRDAGYRLGPALKSVFAPEERIACGFRLPPSGAPVAGTALRLSVSNDMGEVRGVDLAAAQTAEAFKVSLPVEGLPVGRYRISLQAGSGSATATLGALAFALRGPEPEIP